MKTITLFFGLLLICNYSFADSYAVYDEMGKIVNVIVYDGIVEYDETVFHGAKAKKVLLGKDETGHSVGIGNTYIDGKFEKKETDLIP